MIPVHAPRAIRMVLLPILTACLCACGGAHSRYSSHLARGKQFLAQGELDKARVEFGNSAQIEPRNPEALYYLGRVSERRGDFREAAAAYQGAIDARNDFDSARASLGRLYVLGGAPDRAFDIIGPGLERHPNDAELLAVRAAAHSGQSDVANAVKDGERAYQSAPASENVVAVLASVYSRMGDPARAIAVVEGALAKVPDSTDLRAVLVSLYLLTSQQDKAEEQMRRIIELQPREVAARNQLAAHLLHDGKIDEAQAVLEGAVRDLSGENNSARANQAKLSLVDFLVARRSTAEGEKKLRYFLTQEPDNLDLHLALGDLLQRTGARVAAAAVIYQKVIDRDGTGARGAAARNRLAALRLLEGRTEVARKLVADSLAKNPRDPDALILRSEIAMRNNDAASAITDLRAVLRDRPRSVPLHRALARAFLQKGEPVLAEEAFKSALDVAPGDSGARIELAGLLARTSRTDRAVALLEEGLARAPADEQLRLALFNQLLANGDIGAARKLGEELKASKPDSPVGPYLVGLVAIREKRWEQSISELERALALKPDAIEILEALAMAENGRGKPAAALARIQAAADRSPANPRVANLLGEVLLVTKDFQTALLQFERAGKLNPNWWVPYRNRAIAHLAIADTAAAVRDYEAGLKVAPLETSFVIEAAQALERQGEVDAAIAAYRALYAGNGSARQIAANNLAMLLANYRTDHRSLDEARELTAAFSTSDNSSLLDTNGWVRFKRGEYQEALPILERASERSPESRLIHYHLGMTQLQLGLREQARSSLESALAGSGGFDGAAEARIVLAGLKSRA